MQNAKLLPLLFALCAWATPVDLQAKDLDNREFCEGSGHEDWQNVGDGDPHQNFVFKQVSGTTDCDNNPSGSAAVTDTQTVGWSINIGGNNEFFSGGFSVTESTSTGQTQSFGCKTNSGTQPGSLCVFERIQTTAYTARVRSYTFSTCPGAGKQGYSDWSNPMVITAPNSVQGNCYYDNYQVNLPCGPLGTEHRISDGPAGGPQFIPCFPYLPGGK